MKHTENLSQNIQDMKEYVKTKLGLDKPIMSRQQFIINGVIVFILGVLFESFSWREYAPYIFVQLAVLAIAGFIYIPSLIKRSRDVGWGEVWWVGLIPFINFIYFIALIIRTSKNMNNNNTVAQTDKENTINQENKPLQFKTIDRVLFWIGVILVFFGILTLLDVLLSILLGSDNPKIQTDLIVALFYVVIGGILFVSKKRKLKTSVEEKVYKKTVKTVYIVIATLLVITFLPVFTLFFLKLFSL